MPRTLERVAGRRPSADGRDPDALSVVFVLHSLSYLRFFESAFSELLDRGHALTLLLQLRPRRQPEELWIAEMEAHPRFSWRVTKALNRDAWRKGAKRLRRTVDYLHFMQPSFARTPYLVLRAEQRAPRTVVRLSRLPFVRARPVLLALGRALEALDHALPSARIVERDLAAADPDVVVLSPHLMPGSRDSEYLKSAGALGVPSCLAVASWDNLSSKQFLHELPDVLLVWNETQRQEAIELHRVPPERIVVTGAQNFDLWFDWRPRDRRAFCASVGLDPDRAYLLYLGGSLFPGELTEAEFAHSWLEALRRAGDSLLASAGVLVRPHPSRVDEWDAVRFDDLEDVVLWPMRMKEMPISGDARADFFDSIFHSSAVVGLNTSAMIEAAIVGKPVHTLLVPQFSSSQEGVFHFDYLLRVGGGATRVARSLDEHLEQLGEAVRGADEPAASARRRAFLEAFVRPHGLDQPATPLFVDAIEQAAAAGPRREVALSLRVARRVLGLLPRMRPKDVRPRVAAVRRWALTVVRGRRGTLPKQPARPRRRGSRV